MFKPILNGNEIIGAYNLQLVFLSYFIAAFASYTALDLAMRIGESHGKTKKFWIGGCSFATVSYTHLTLPTILLV